MAKVTTGSSFGLNVKQAQACRMLAEGAEDKDIMQIIFGVTKDSTFGEKQKARKTLNKWMQLPGFADCYRAIVKEYAYPTYGRAVARITKQIDDSNGWLANKAANDVLTRFGPVVMGDESREIKLVVEGAPFLGAPSVETET